MVLFFPFILALSITLARIYVRITNGAAGVRRPHGLPSLRGRLGVCAELARRPGFGPLRLSLQSKLPFCG